MSARLRKIVLTIHVAISVGWLGALLAYLALDLTAAINTNAATVRAAYLAMDLTVRYAIVPLALGSVLIGIINALGTPWGLLRHYWVLVKLLLTVFATTILLIETDTVSSAAAAIAAGADPARLPGTLLHSVGGTVVLLVILILSIFKPRGLTRYGWRKQQEQRPQQHSTQTAPAP